MSDSDLELYGIVGRMFREIRESRDLSLEIVAEYLQIAPKSLQRYECGERKIKIGTIKQLCVFYKIEYDDFIREAKLRFGKNIYKNESSKEESPKIMQYYDQLNDIGKHKATEQVKLLTEVPKYLKEDTEFSTELAPDKDYLKPQAAHNNNESEEQVALMQEDMAILKRPQ